MTHTTYTPSALGSAAPPFAAARARQALQRAGLPTEVEMEPVSSTRNEVLMAGEYVVRINRQPNQRLHREAQLCQALPIRRWTPRVVAHGDELGADYLVVARRPGEPLSRCWVMMSRDQRRRAIRQLAEVLDEIHQTPVPDDVPRLGRTTHLLDPSCVNPIMPLVIAVDRLAEHEHIDVGLMNAVQDRLLEFGDSLSDYSTDNMIHGDLSFENVLWDGTNISAVLDFEWSRGAPGDLDLDMILRYCALPFAHVPEPYAHHCRTEDYESVPVWLAEDLPRLFATDRLGDRLALFSIAFDVNELESDLPDRNRHGLGPLHPINRLATFVADGGGYTRDILTRAGVTT